MSNRKLIKRTVVVLGGLGVASLAAIAPVIPGDEMRWVHSYETALYETATGDLDFSEYSTNAEGECFTRLEPSDIADNQIVDCLLIEGKKYVKMLDEKAYYDVFYDGERYHRVRSTAQKYKSLGSIRNYPQPTRKKMESLLSANIARAGITLDAVSTDGEPQACAGGTTSISWSHTTAGDERLLVVGYSLLDSTDADRTVTTHTYNSVNIADIREDDNDTDNISSVLTYLTAPDTGANTISTTFNGPITNCGAYAISLNGVDQTTPIDSHNGNIFTSTTLSPSISITSTSTNTWLLHTAVEDVTSFYIYPGTYISSSQATTSSSVFINNAGSMVGGIAIESVNEAAGASYTATWQSTTATNWALSGVLLTPASCTPSASVRCTEQYLGAGFSAWTVPSGQTTADWACWGGGGAGFDGGSSGGGAGGGGGAFASSTVTGLTAGTRYDIYVGTGGVGSSVNGATSTIATTTVVASPGGGGKNATTAEGVGGKASLSTGTITNDGGVGGSGIDNGTHDGGGGGGGAGGSSGDGVGGSDATATTGGSGGAGDNGNGGAGGTASEGSTNQDGWIHERGAGGGAGGDNGTAGGASGGWGAGGGGGEAMYGVGGSGACEITVPGTAAAPVVDASGPAILYVKNGDLYLKDADVYVKE